MGDQISPNDVMERGEARGSGSTVETNDASLAAPPDPPQGGIFLGRRWPFRLFSRSNRTKAYVKPRKPIVRALNDCQPGYPRLAAFLDSDENFMLYRRFGFLQARVLLNKQDELRALENDLDCLDDEDGPKDWRILFSRTEDFARNPRRRELLHKIEKNLKEYGELLVLARDLASFNRPPSKDYQSVKAYFDQTDPVCTVESYIYRREDIVALKPGRETAWLDAVVERALEKMVCPLTQYLFSTTDLLKKTSYESTQLILYSRDRIGIVVLTIILIMIVAILVLPVYILLQLTQNSSKPTSGLTSVIIAVLLVFTLLFSLILSKFTRAKRHEILASAAAYCAILVVFVGNFGQSKKR